MIIYVFSVFMILSFVRIINYLYFLFYSSTIRHKKIQTKVVVDLKRMEIINDFDNFNNCDDDYKNECVDGEVIQNKDENILFKTTNYCWRLL